MLRVGENDAFQLQFEHNISCDVNHMTLYIYIYIVVTYIFKNAFENHTHFEHVNLMDCIRKKYF
jgi:hypothetical protein